MKKFLKIALAAVLSLLGLVFVALLCLGGSILAYSARDKKAFANAQTEHLAALEEAYNRPGFAPADEAAMTGFDVAANLDARLNEIRFLGTHNSYKAYNPSAEKLMQRLIAPLHLADAREWSYGSEPLAEQFDRGIRSIELDVMRERDGFRCAHIPVVDYASVCPDFALALREIALWSGAHPGHLPITVLIEAKETLLSGGMLFHRFSLDDALALDALVADALGARLCTPSEMLGEYEDFARLRAANGYPALAGLLGKIIVIYHYNDATSVAYAAHDPALRTQSMFPSIGQWAYYEDAETDDSYACFLIDNWSDSPYMRENTQVKHMLVRTRADVFPWRDDEWEAQAMATGAFILTTDFPPRGDPGDDPHVAAFAGGATVAKMPK